MLSFSKFSPGRFRDRKLHCVYLIAARPIRARLHLQSYVYPSLAIGKAWPDLDGSLRTRHLRHKSRQDIHACRDLFESEPTFDICKRRKACRTITSTQLNHGVVSDKGLAAPIEKRSVQFKEPSLIAPTVLERGCDHEKQKHRDVDGRFHCDRPAGSEYDGNHLMQTHPGPPYFRHDCGRYSRSRFYQKVPSGTRFLGYTDVVTVQASQHPGHPSRGSSQLACVRPGTREPLSAGASWMDLAVVDVSLRRRGRRGGGYFGLAPAF